MGTDSGIEYVNHSLNFWIGCTPVPESPACENCYARRGMARFGRDPNKVVRTSRATWRQPLAKDRKGRYKWRPGDYVFVCSWSDFFHKDADQWRIEAWDLMRERPDLNWVIVTKRIERASGWTTLYWKPKNRIILATCENQAMANKRIPELINLSGRFDNLILGVSLEPLLEQIDLTRMDFSAWETTSFVNVLSGEIVEDSDIEMVGTKENGLDWVVLGCENLNGRVGRFREKVYYPKLARKVSYEKMRSLEDQNRWWNAAREIKEQCDATGVPFFMKQGPVKGKVCRDINLFPEDMRVREYPK